ncbi:kinase-like domain-containing protein [Aspergillus pseudoustus]|uniref:Kinase-like domain-containing protein n=1 Tax=Aspergillus pseudoustus TaxID=1810923 RepID=A0ABR4JQX9_9EURO
MAGPVRQHIDIANFERYLRDAIPEISTPITLKQFGFGQSCPTYQIIANDGQKFVLRKKPPGDIVSKTAHRVDREFTVLSALQSTDVPVPKVYTYCDYVGVIGTPFYASKLFTKVMEFLDGRIFEDPSIPGVSPRERNEIWHQAVLTLAKLHRIDPATVGLENYGSKSNYFLRQVQAFAAIQQAQAAVVDCDTQTAIGPIEGFEKVLAYLENPSAQPAHRRCLVHGDFKIDNLIFHPTENRVIGILDWEMSTIGHPLSDLSNLLMPFTWQLAQSQNSVVLRTLSPGALQGLPTSAQVVEQYRQQASYDPGSSLTYGNAFVLMKNCVILHGIKARVARKQASSALATQYAMHLARIVQLAVQVADEGKELLAVNAGDARDFSDVSDARAKL